MLQPALGWSLPGAALQAGSPSSAGASGDTPMAAGSPTRSPGHAAAMSQCRSFGRPDAGAPPSPSNLDGGSPKNVAAWRACWPQQRARGGLGCGAAATTAPAGGDPELPPVTQSRLSKLHHLHREVDASRWCVTIKDLEKFESQVRKAWEQGDIPPNDEFESDGHNDPAIGPTIYQVCEHFIKPATLKAGGMSWALMEHPEGLECDVFATHCWAEGIFEFTSKVKKAWPVDHQARNLYCCFLANPQNGGIEEILENDPRMSPFAKALGKAKHFLVIPNRKVSIYSRLWCVYEAHLAVEFAKERGLKITLPAQVSHEAFLRHSLPGLVLFTAGFALAFFVLAQVYGRLCGPLLWLLASILLSSMVGGLTRRVATPLCRPRIRMGVILASYWSEVLVTGHGLGLAFWHLKGYGMARYDPQMELEVKMGNNRAFEPGEGWACVPLAFSVVILYMSHIARQLNLRIAQHEGGLLKFTSVKAATCTCQRDEARIRAAIRGHGKKIDQVIRILSQAGKYDQELVANVASGMSARHAREGANPFKIFIAVWTWEYWWVTDLAANWHRLACFVVPFVSCLIAWLGWYLFRDHTIFAFDVAYFGGLTYVAASKITSLIWGKGRPDTPMSVETLRMQLVVLAVIVLLSAYHYSGIRKRLWGRGNQKHSAECTGAARFVECDSDSSEDQEEIAEEFSFIECCSSAAGVADSDDYETSGSSSSGPDV